MAWNDVSLAFLYVLLLVGFFPFLLKVWNFGASDDKRPTGLKCDRNPNITIPKTYVSKYESFSVDLDNSNALFVHFTANNLNLQPSKDTLDPLNLVWVENTEAPFLSLDLGFNYYSLGMLSRKVYHMNVMINEDSRSSMRNMNYACATKTLATAFLQQVTKAKGTVCYISPAMTYRCCEEELATKKIHCGIPALISPEMIAIFLNVVILGMITLFGSPLLLDCIPKIDSSESLTSNTQININPVYQFIKSILQNLYRSYSKRRVDLARDIVIGTIFVPLIFYCATLFNFLISEYEIPKMFNNDVQESWHNQAFITTLEGYWFHVVSQNVLVFYNIIICCSIVVFHFIPLKSESSKLDVLEQTLVEELTKIKTKEKNFKIDWMTPIHDLKDFFRVADRKYSSYFGSCFLTNALFRFVKIVISPFMLIGFVFVYVGHILPIVHVILLPFLERGDLAIWWIRHKVHRRFGLISRVTFAILLSIPLYLTVFFATECLGIIIANSLLFISRLIVYTYMGLVANKDDILPKLTLFSVFVFYVWDNFKAAKRQYQKLLMQTFENCKQQKELPEQAFKICKMQHDLLQQANANCKDQFEILKQFFMQCKQHHEHLKQTVNAFDQKVNFLEQMFEDLGQHPQRAQLSQVLQMKTTQQKFLEETLVKCKQKHDQLSKSLETFAQQKELVKEMLELTEDDDQKQRLKQAHECIFVQQEQLAKQISEFLCTEEDNIKQCLDNCIKQQDDLHQDTFGQNALDNSKKVLGDLNKILQQSVDIQEETRPEKTLDNLKERLDMVEKARLLLDGTEEQEGFPHKLTIANYNEQHTLLVLMSQLSATRAQRRKFTKQASEVAEKKEHLQNTFELIENTKQQQNILGQIIENSLQQVIINQTTEKCEQHQESLANIIENPPLQLDYRGVPTLSNELFQKVVDEILPLGEVYTKLFVKILLVWVFIWITYNAILIYGRSKLSDTTRALAIFFGTIIIKFFDIFHDHSEQLHDVENSYRIGKVFKNFIITRKSEIKANENQSRNDENEIAENRPSQQDSINDGDVSMIQLEASSDTTPLLSCEV